MSGDDASLLGLILRRDRVIGLVALILFTAVAWWYLLQGAGMRGDMMSMSGMDMTQEWTPAYAGLVFAMWWVMMIAMMLPSAAPMILLHGLVSRHQEKRGVAPASSGIFLLGYLGIWGAFSALATILQWQLQRLALLSPAMQLSSSLFGGAILVAAGLYQLTPLRESCLQHCRGPMEFVTRHWLPGTAGAWRMGIRHGIYCLGCCWMLMTLLFYGGVMNLYWIIGLAIFVFVEKLLPGWRWVSRAAGAALIAWGLAGLVEAAGIGS
ncbi:MAG: DUF2182 domain-containing protein [Steroidobacteraceae bacterium]